MKKCSFEGCTNNQFGGGFCLRHQHKRTDKPKQAQNKPYNQRSVKSSIKVPPKQKSGLKHELQRSFGFTNQKQMFDFVWSTREHKCQISGSNLDLVPENRRHWTMAHIIPKGLYPMFKLNPDNILLISPEAHQLVDNFTEDLREKHKHINFDLWFSLVEKKKEEYKRFLKENQI